VRRHTFRIDDITHNQSGSIMSNAMQHRLPISAVNEGDDDEFPDIIYLHSSVAGEGVSLQTPPEFLVGCAECAGSGHSTDLCSSDATCNCCQEQVRQSGGIVYDEHRRLRRPESAAWIMPIYECNAACSCPPDCRNRVVQRGICKSIQVFKTRHKGWAVRALERIPIGSFVVEYVGEVITTEEAERRGIEYDKGGFSTLFDLDAAGVDCEYTIDATYKCGVARFLNHSCAPNLRQFCVWVDTLSLALPRIAFFAIRDIEPNEELTFDYRYEEGGRTLECHCGAANCRKWLY